MAEPAIITATPNQVNIYRNIRLQALCTDPEVYIDEILASYDAPLQHWEADLIDPNKRILFAIDEDNPKQAAAIQIVNRTRDGRGLLNSLYTMPTYRSQGLARRIIESGIRVAEDEWGLNTVYTEVLHTNVRFMRVFEELGFVASGAKVIGRDRYPKPFGEYALTRTRLFAEK